MDPILSRLAGELDGMLIDPSHTDYDRARAIWNGSIDRRPAAVARVRGAADVSRVLRRAGEAGLAVCVRGGGHSVPGHSMIDGAVVIDLSGLRDVRVEADKSVAHVGGGALWSDVDGATSAQGLATTGGLISHTGVGGLTLGGGIGWLMRKHGLAIDNLVGAEVVLADGRTVSAHEGENEDLYWGLRGGGGNFGVVTRFDFRLHPVRQVLAGMVLHPAARAKELLQFFRDFTANAPDELTALFASLVAPPAPFIPPPLQGTSMVAVVVCWCGDPVGGEAALRALRSFGPPAVDAIMEMPYAVLQSMLDAGAPAGWRYHMKATYLDDLDGGAIDALAGHAPLPSPLSQVHVHHLGGAVSRVEPGATPYPHRRSPFLANLIAACPPTESPDAHASWARSLYDALLPHSSKTGYVNFLGDEGDARVRAAYGDNFARLARIKHAYDPGNVFRHNHNITPERV
jgi:FAD/FMN-containing dehydrogenase